MTNPARIYIECSYECKAGLKKIMVENRVYTRFKNEVSREDHLAVSASVEGKYVAVSAKVENAYESITKSASEQEQELEIYHNSEIEMNPKFYQITRKVTTTFTLPGGQTGQQIEISHVLTTETEQSEENLVQRAQKYMKENFDVGPGQRSLMI